MAIRAVEALRSTNDSGSKDFLLKDHNGDESDSSRTRSASPANSNSQQGLSTHSTKVLHSVPADNNGGGAKSEVSSSNLTTTTGLQGNTNSGRSPTDLDVLSQFLGVSEDDVASGGGLAGMRSYSSNSTPGCGGGRHLSSTGIYRSVGDDEGEIGADELDDMRRYSSYSGDPSSLPPAKSGDAQLKNDDDVSKSGESMNDQRVEGANTGGNHDDLPPELLKKYGGLSHQGKKISGTCTSYGDTAACLQRNGVPPPLSSVAIPSAQSGSRTSGVGTVTPSSTLTPGAKTTTMTPVSTTSTVSSVPSRRRRKAPPPNLTPADVLTATPLADQQQQGSGSFGPTSSSMGVTPLGTQQDSSSASIKSLHRVNSGGSSNGCGGRVGGALGSFGLSSASAAVSGAGGGVGTQTPSALNASFGTLNSTWAGSSAIVTPTSPAPETLLSRLSGTLASIFEPGMNSTLGNTTSSTTSATETSPPGWKRLMSDELYIPDPAARFMTSSSRLPVGACGHLFLVKDHQERPSSSSSGAQSSRWFVMKQIPLNQSKVKLRRELTHLLTHYKGKGSHRHDEEEEKMGSCRTSHDHQVVPFAFHPNVVKYFFHGPAMPPNNLTHWQVTMELMDLGCLQRILNIMTKTCWRASLPPESSVKGRKKNMSGPAENIGMQREDSVESPPPPPPGQIAAERIFLARNIGFQMLLGLNYLHNSKRTIHRDVKPGNVLMNTNGEVKVCDFDTAKDTTMSMAKTEVGTVAYTAPEVLQRTADLVMCIPSPGGSKKGVSPAPLGGGGDPAPSPTKSQSTAINASNALGYTEKCDSWGVGMTLFSLLAPGGTKAAYPSENIVYLCSNPDALTVNLKPIAEAAQQAEDYLVSLSGKNAEAEGRGELHLPPDIIRPQEGGREGSCSLLSAVDQLQSLVQGLLQKDPDMRFSTGEALSHPFFAGCTQVSNRKGSSDDGKRPIEEGNNILDYADEIPVLAASQLKEWIKLRGLNKKRIGN